MNTIRMMAIALPMTLLLACGGGGGSSTAVAPTPMNTPDPMAPGTMDDLDMPPTVTLPGYAITNLAIVRNTIDSVDTAVGSGSVSNMTETQIVSAIQTRATAADTFEFSDFSGSVSITCSNNDSCSGTVPNVGSLTFSLNDIEDLSLVDDTDLVGFESDSQAVMEHRGVTMIQSQAAAGQNDGTHLAFQTYGGWLTGSVFGVELLDVTENGTTTSRYASFSFGNDSGSRPTLTAILTNWEGVLVGRNANGDLFQGVTTITLGSDAPSFISTIHFNLMTNLSTNTNNIINSFLWSRIPLATDGTFASTSGDIKGSFYGTGHEEAGGTFNRNGIIGAFGAIRK